MITSYLAVFVGGGIGSVVRLLVSSLLAPSGTQFPWATFLINVLGSFLLGVFLVLMKDRQLLLAYAMLGTGFCGGFTTFSTFSVEVVQLMQRDRIDLAGAYVIGSIGIGILVAWVGMRAVG